MTWQTKEYQSWYQENEHWLKPYAVFCFLRDLFGTSKHWKWGVFSSPTDEVKGSFVSGVCMPLILCPSAETRHAVFSASPKRPRVYQEAGGKMEGIE